KGMPSMAGAVSGLGARQSGWSTTNERYRDDQKEFKTRGFSLQVVMDNHRIPDLLVALSNSPNWPINVLRAQEADYKDEDLIPADGEMSMGGRSSMSSPMSRGGMSRGMSSDMMMRSGGGRSGGASRPMLGSRTTSEEGGEGYTQSRSAL